MEQEFQEFVEDIRLDAESDGDSMRSAFFKRYSSLATENGDCADLQPITILREGRGGYQVDGYAVDSEHGIFYVAVCDFREGTEIQTLNAAQLEAAIEKARRLLDLVLAPSYSETFKKGSPEFEFGSSVASSQATLRRIQILVFSNARLSTRKPPELAQSLHGLQVVSNVLDFSRYAAIQKSRGTVEPIEINIAELANEPLPCLPASAGAGEYESYLLVIPGELLAAIYSLYGGRLLEQNVRTFLQARTKVNKDIITTIRERPEMFFAYNNGLSATASGVRTTRLSDGRLGIEAIEDLQIVNGGQTTASILYARDQASASLKDVFVQMKLSIVKPELVEEIVPRISRYANSQNRISEADFFSSHPFHLTTEKLSRRLAPPPRAGSTVGSKWFYERARGQYKDASAYGSAADKRRFELEFPKNQLFDKTDLAKYELTFAGLPHTVCLGAQKCFLSFAEKIAKQWEASSLSFNENWFKTAVARALIFRWTDQMVGRSEWYQADRGFKAQTVAYSVAWLIENIRKSGKAGLNLQRIWNLQELPDEVEAALTVLAPQVAKAIRSTPDTVRNVGEFCKQQACWAMVSRLKFEMPLLPASLLIDVDDEKEAARTAAGVQGIDLDIEFDSLLVELSSSVSEVAAFAKKKSLLSPKSDSALKKLAGGQFSLSPPERNALRHLLGRMKEKGFQLPKPAGTGPKLQINLSGRAIKRVNI